MRQQWRNERYLGIELEMNQRLVGRGDAAARNLQRHLLASLRQTLEEHG